MFNWTLPLQYQFSPATATATKQNGDTPTVKTTTIHIASGASNTTLSTNTNGNNSGRAVSHVLAPVQVSIGADTIHTCQDTMGWGKGRSLGAKTVSELENDVIATDKQSKPSSDTL